MADLTVTASNVAPQTGYKSRQGIAGEAIDAGECVYIDTADSDKIKLADNGAVATAVVAGIAVNSAAAGNEVSYMYSGTVDIGSGVGKGEVYVVSATAGKIAPVADLGTTEYLSILCYGSTTAQLTININNTGITHT